MSKVVISNQKLYLEANPETGKIVGYQVKGLCGTKVEFDFDISELAFCHSRTTLLGKKCIVFGCHVGKYVSFKESASAIQPLEDLILRSTTKINAVDSFYHIKKAWFSEYSLWANKTHVIHLKFGLLGDPEVNSVTCEEVVFFNKKQSLCCKPELYFGYHNQISCEAPDSEFSSKLYDYLIANGAKVGQDVDSVYQPVFSFNPLNWFINESISFNKEAIIYTIKKSRSIDTMYLPFKDIKMVYTTSGLFTRKLTIVGEMHVVTRRRFCRGVIGKLMAELKALGVNTKAEGVSFKTSSLWFRWLAFWRKDATLTIGEKNLFISPGKWGGVYKRVPIHDPILMKNYLDENATEEELLEDDNRDKELVAVSKGAVVEAKFKKKSCFSIFGTLMIDYDMGASIRKDQKEAVTYGRIVIGRIRSSRASDAISLIERK
jgi:hypothetical protein